MQIFVNTTCRYYVDIHDSSSTRAQQVTDAHYFDNAYWMSTDVRYSSAESTVDKVDMVSSPHGTFTLVGDMDL